MDVLDNLPVTGSCRVGVSGWDEDEIFFVEKSQLAWEDADGKHVFLQHKLAEGAMVFVRLLHSSDYQQSCPAAYRADFIGPGTEVGYEFRLSRAPPPHSPVSYAVNELIVPSHFGTMDHFGISNSYRANTFPSLILFATLYAVPYPFDI